MRIAFVLDDSLDPPDGVQQYVLTLGRWLTKQGHYVAYITAESERSDVEHLYDLGRYVTTRFNGNIVRTPKPVSGASVRSALAEIRPDIVHVQMPYSPLFAGKIIKAVGPATAVVGTFHILPTGPTGLVANQALGIATRSTLKRFDAVCAVSEAATAFARRVYRLNATLIPNLIDASRFAVPIPAEASKRVRVVFLGRLVPRKGVLQLVAAFNGLPDETAAKAELIIGGKGPLTDRARRLARKDRSIRFEGFIHESAKAAFLGSAQIAVFPSLGGESFGIILLEAMASGAEAVLAGDNPGYRSVMKSMPEALFDPHNTAELTNKLVALIQDSKARQEMRARQRTIALRHDVSVIGPRIVELYQEAVETRRQVPQAST